MRTSEFKKLKKEKTPQRIIGLYIHWKINLTGKQIDELLKLKEVKKLKKHIDKPRKIRLGTRLYTLSLKIRGKI